MADHRAGIVATIVSPASPGFWAAVVIPLAAGTVVWRAGWMLEDSGAVFSGATFLTGVLLGVLYQSFSRARETVDELSLLSDSSLSNSVLRHRAHRRLNAITAMNAMLAWATLVSLALMALSFAMRIIVAPAVVGTLDAQEGLRRTFTAVSVVVVTHLVLIAGHTVRRLYAVIGSQLDGQMATPAAIVQTEDRQAG